MALTAVAAGAWAFPGGPTGSVAPAMPSGWAAGDLLVLSVHWKQTGATLPVPSGYQAATPVVSGGTGAAYAAAAGNVSVRHFVRIAQAGDTAPTVGALTGGSTSNTTGNVFGAQISAWRATTGIYDIAYLIAGQNTSSTSWSLAAAALTASTASGAQFNNTNTVAVNDWFEGYAGMTVSSTTQSAHAFTRSGGTFSSLTVTPTKAASTVGADLGSTRWQAQLTTAGSGNVGSTHTQSAANYGVYSLLRIREASPAAQTMTATGIASEEAFPGGGSSTKNILVVHDDVGPSADDTNMINFLTGKGHTVTTQLETSAIPDTGYDCVIVTESGSSSSAAVTSIPACLLPVMMFETTINTARLASAAMVTGGTAGTTWDLSTHSLNTGYPDPLTMNSASSSHYGTADTNLAAGMEILAYAPGSTHVTAAIAASGAALTTGNAPNRRAYMGLISTRLSGIVGQTDSGNWFNDVVVWLGGGAGGGGGHTVTQPAGATQTMTATAIGSAEAFGSPTVQALAPGAQGLSPTGIASGEAFPGGGGSSNPALPVQLNSTSVEPESSGYNPTVIDSNGNLYRIMESQLAANNQPRALKSTDGGATWVEQDAANRPGTDTGSIGDLESAWTTYDTVRKAITFTWQRSYVAYSQFRTSDHPTNPDTWVSNTRENMQASTGSPQYASHTSPTNQSYEWVFFNNSTTKPSYKSRTSSGTYGSVLDVDSAGQHPAAILDSNNVSHIIYIKSSQLHYKNLTSGGTLQGTSTRVDSGGVNTTAPIAHAPPQAWVNGGNTYVGCLFADGSGIAKFVLITNGTPGSEETVSGSAVVLDPGATVNQSAILSLAVDPTNGTMHAIWSQVSNGDLMHASRPAGGAWSSPTTLQNPAFTPAWVFAKVNTYPSGLRVLSYNYVQEIADDQSNAFYGEMVLGGGGGGHTATIVAASATNMQPTGLAGAEAFGTTVVTPRITLIPTGVASLEAFGTTATLGKITVTAVGVSSAEVFGTTALAAKITSIPTGIASAEAFGTAVLSTVITLSPVALGSAEAFGTAVLSPRLTSSPLAIASAEAFGTTVVAPHLTVTPVAIASAEVFGTTSLGALGGPQTMIATGIASAQAFGTTALTTLVLLSPSGLASAEAFGAPTLARFVTLTPTGLASAEAVGNPSLTRFVVLTPTGIASAEAFGASTIGTRIVVIPSSVTTAEAVGSPVVASGLTLLPGGVASAEALGNPTLSAVLLAAPSGIASAEAHGSPSVLHIRTVNPTAIGSGEAFGTTVLLPRITVSPSGIASGEVVPNPSAASGLTLFPTAIASAQAFGTPVAMWPTTTSPTGVGSAEAFGLPAVSGLVSLVPNGIVSAQAFGTPSLLSVISLAPLGISSAEAVPNVVVVPKVTVLPSGIVSVEHVSTGLSALPRVSMGPLGIATLEAVGIPALGQLLPQQYVSPQPIASLEAWGLPAAFIIPVSWVAATDAEADWTDEYDTSGNIDQDGTSAVWTSEESTTTW